MSIYLNEVRLIGNLGDVPQIKACTNGATLFKFRMCTDKEWHSIEYFAQSEKQAAYLAERLTKGALVYVAGEIGTDKWIDRDGKSQIWKKIKATDLKIIHESINSTSMIETGLPADFNPDDPAFDEDRGLPSAPARTATPHPRHPQPHPQPREEELRHGNSQGPSLMSRFRGMGKR